VKDMTTFTEPPVLCTDPERPGPLEADLVGQFDADGFTVARGLVPAAEAASFGDEFMAIAERGPILGHFDPKAQGPGDPDLAKKYPRIMYPHLFHQRSMDYLLDVRITDVVAQLLGDQPIACQTMLYFKPPGARGQALHQDNFYLRVEPGTCIAAWMALDVVDRANGGLEVVPGTHQMGIECPEEADPALSFTRQYVPPPAGLSPVPVDMQPGDVLFFNGSLLHGSGPNTTADRFRRSFISHYASSSTERIAEGYPTARMNGERFNLPVAEGGGPCGTEFDDVRVYDVKAQQGGH
jgi:phytanoyl-CoA hydroxylase